MGLGGSNIFSNAEQSATVANNYGTIDWSSLVYPYFIDSTSLFTAFPLQSVQSGTSYPYWNIASPWDNGTTETVSVQFNNVLNCNWIQNMVWVIYSETGTPPTTTVTSTTTTEEPTLIELSDMRAVPGDREVMLLWRTESEIDTAGFNIYRSEAGSDEPTKINESLIPSRGSSTAGAEYTITDTKVSNGITYRYTLEDVDTNGFVTRHKPVTATPRWVYSLFH